MFRGESHRNGPYLYSKWSWCCTASLAAAFVSSDPVSYCWPATEGRVARVPIHFIQCCLTPRLCTGCFSLWEPQNPCQSSLDWSGFGWFWFFFCLKQAHKILLWAVSLHLLWAVRLNAELPYVFSVCARSVTQLEWCSALGWCWWSFLSLCLLSFFPERNFKDAEAVGKMKRMQIISTSRPAWHLLLSSWRQSGIIDSGCCCSNINIFPV